MLPNMVWWKFNGMSKTKKVDIDTFANSNRFRTESQNDVSRAQATANH